MADGAALLEYLSRTPAAADIDAFCPDCARTFCRDHYAIEAERSGSWHTGTTVTCPAGHSRETA